MTHPSNRNPVWESVDWTRSDRELAADLGLTRQRVNKVRKVLGARAPLPTTQPLRVRVAELPIEELTTREMADCLGVKRASVAKVCQRLGRKPKPSQGTYSRSHSYRQRLEALDTSTMTVPEIMAALGAKDVQPTYFYNLLSRHKVPYRRRQAGRRRKG